MEIYLAGPFFNETEVKNMEILEKELTDNGIEFYSPRQGKYSVMYSEAMRGSDAKLKDYYAWLVYKDNLDNLDNCNIVLAVVDNRDTGTMWELGYATAIIKTIVTTTFEDFGLNIMIGKCTHCHTKTYESRSLVYQALNRHSISRSDLHDAFSLISDSKGDLE